MFPINFPANDTVPVDPEIWEVCAGRAFKLPEVDTDVYYFPEGHAEQCDLPQAVASFFRPMVPCCVQNVRYLADRVIDDLFAAIFLQPTGSHFRGATSASSQVGFGGDLTLSIGAQREGSHIAWDTKVLTQSDVGNGNRFSVPKRCAMSIFPPLKLEEDPPVQILTISDVQAGINWEFRYVYQGGQYWLTSTGWKTFCDYKRLVAGDTVVLMKDKITGKLYIGIRRLPRGGAESNRSRPLHLGAAGGGTGDSQRFVVEAAKYAAQGLPFEVVLYPKNGFTDFVVKADLVDMALSLRWAVGMRVKKNVAAGDCSMPRWIFGRVSMVMIPWEGGQWRGSPWKMLEITWDQLGPQLPHNVERQSPWQLEHVEETSLAPIVHPRNNQPLIHWTHSPKAQGEPWSAPHTQLASMQGARHSSDVSDLIGGDTYQMQSDEMSDMSLLKSRITEVNPGRHQLVNLSSESHSSLRSYGPEVGNSLPHDGDINSIKLFGKIINVQNPVEKVQPDDDAAHCLETDSSKGDKEAEGVDKLNHHTSKE
ncbi:unnamed protein product [Rhodiola kirilowii]